MYIGGRVFGSDVVITSKNVVRGLNRVGEEGI
jgi:hypothetical protein